MASEQKENEDNVDTTTTTTTVVELRTIDIKVSDDQATEEQAVDNVKTIEEMQKMFKKSQPSLKDVVNHKITWKEFLGFYNVLRVVIASTLGLLIFLSTFGIAYLLNPNSCKIQRTNPNRLQWHPFANMLVGWFYIILVTIPVLKIFGPHWLWTTKKINTLILILSILTFFALMPYPFLLNVHLWLYWTIITAILGIIMIVYVFISDGFYLFWFLFPFGITIMVLFIILIIFGLLFMYYIPATSPFFGVTYSFMITLLQSFGLKYTSFAFPYKWGKCYTCPWNKNKIRLVQSHKATEDNKSVKVTIEDELSDLLIYYISMVFTSAFEAMRVSGYVKVKGIDQRWELVQLIIASIIFECIARNNLFWEFVYRLILKKPNPGWGRIHSIYYGAKYQAEYIPIGCIWLINLFKYGPTKQCGHVRNAQLNDNVNIGDDLWWLVAVMIMTEALSDGLAEMVLRIGRCAKWFGVKNENGEDPPRETILVKVNLFPMMWIVVHCYIIAIFAFGLENTLVSGIDV